MNNIDTLDIVFLKTNLFGKTNELLEAVSDIAGTSTEMIELQPEQMGEAEWDVVVNLVLRAEKVVTV